MLIVKIKNKKHSFTIPVPYAALHMGSSIMRSSLVKRPLKDWLNKQGEDAAGKLDWESESSRFGIELVLMILEHPSTKPVVRQLIKELKQCKGTVLADIKAQDGTNVLIKL